MKNNTLIAIFLLFAFLQIHAQSPQKVVNSFFEALNSKNHERLKELCLEDMQLHSLAIGQERLVNTQTRLGFSDGIKSISKNNFTA